MKSPCHHRLDVKVGTDRDSGRARYLMKQECERSLVLGKRIVKERRKHLSDARTVGDVASPYCVSGICGGISAVRSAVIRSLASGVELAALWAEPALHRHRIRKTLTKDRLRVQLIAGLAPDPPNVFTGGSQNAARAIQTERPQRRIGDGFGVHRRRKGVVYAALCVATKRHVDVGNWHSLSNWSATHS